MRCALLILFWGGLSLLAQGQDDTATKLAQLRKHKELWPAQVTLKSPVRLAVFAQGAEVGAVVSPKGALVDLVSVDETTLIVGVGDARAFVDPDETDVWAHVTLPAEVAATSSFALPSPTPAPSPSPTPIPSVPVPDVIPTASAAPAVTGAPLLFDCEVTPRQNFTKAAFRFWSPRYDQPIRGVIVIVPGLDGDGRGRVNDTGWQNLALKYRLAIVACYLQGKGYHDAMKGTGDALLEALKNFSQQSSHLEVATAPLLLYGESAGGQFNYNFALWKPEKVMVFTVNKGGFYDAVAPSAHACTTPGIFFLGLTDSEQRTVAITGIWTAGRKQGALWALTPQPESAHEFSKTPAMALVFFDSVLKYRLPDDSATAQDASQMKPMPENQGWIGDPITHEIHDGSTDNQSNRQASWLPDEAAAKAWQAFVSGP